MLTCLSYRKVRNKFKIHPRNLSLIHGVVLLSIVSTSVTSYANTVDSTFNNFAPTTSGLDYVTVRSSKVLDAGSFSLGLFVDQAVNTLPYFKDPTTRDDNSKSYNDGTTSLNGSIGFGITNDWEIGLSVPYVAAQQIKETDTFHGQFARTGVTAYNLSTKYRLWHNDTVGIAVIGSVHTNRVKNDPFDGQNGGGIGYTGLLASDVKLFPSLTVAGNIGYKSRSPGQQIAMDDGATPIQPIESQILASAAVQYSVTPKFDVVTEMYGYRPQNNDVTPSSSRYSSVSEAIAGVKYHFDNGMIGHAGLGTEVMHSTNSPDFRGYIGLYWIISPTKEVKPTPPPAQPSPLPPPPPAVRSPDVELVVQDVLFSFDSDKIYHPAAVKNLKVLVDALKRKPLETLIIDGHTCQIGTPEYNLKLSQRRAIAIKNFLVTEYGIPSSRIVTHGYGLTRPLASNKTVPGRRQNRRTEFKIYYLQNK